MNFHTNLHVIYAFLIYSACNLLIYIMMYILEWNANHKAERGSYNKSLYGHIIIWSLLKKKTGLFNHEFVAKQ